MDRTNLDIDILRTLVTAQSLGGFNRAAQRVGRSQSAVSQQISRLEDRLGKPIFRKEGRGLVPTEAGGIILSYARRILELNDEAVAAVRGVAVGGLVRFGLQADLTENWLPKALARAKQAHPEIQIEVSADRYAVLIDRLDKGRLDLALLFGPTRRSDAKRITALPMTGSVLRRRRSHSSAASLYNSQSPVRLVISAKLRSTRLTMPVSHGKLVLAV